MKDYVPNAAQAAFHAIRGLDRIHTFVGGRGAGATTALLMDPLVNGYLGTDSWSLFVARDYQSSLRAFNSMRDTGECTAFERYFKLHWPQSGHTSYYKWRSEHLIREVESMRFRHIAVDCADHMDEDEFKSLMILLRGEDSRMVVSVRPESILGDTWQSRVLCNRVLSQGVEHAVSH